MRFKPDDRLVRSDTVIETELDDETILMSIDAGAYYSLGETAQRIWKQLETPATFEAVRAALVNEYRVSPEICTSDLDRFLSAMQEEGLLDVG